MKCKCRFLMTLVLCLAGIVGLRAQSGADRMNEIKLSGKYYTAEATDHDQDKAFVSAFSMLLGSINMALMEEEQPTITSLQLESHVKSIDIQRGADVMVFVYVEKSRLALMQTNGGGIIVSRSLPRCRQRCDLLLRVLRPKLLADSLVWKHSCRHAGFWTMRATWAR